MVMATEMLTLAMETGEQMADQTPGGVMETEMETIMAFTEGTFSLAILIAIFYEFFII